MDREVLLALWGASVTLAVVGLIMTVYFSFKVQEASKRVNQSYSRIIVALVDIIEVYASMIETLDTHNVVPDKHKLPEQFLALREEHKRVAAG